MGTDSLWLRLLVLLRCWLLRVGLLVLRGHRGRHSRRAVAAIRRLPQGDVECPVPLVRRVHRIRVRVRGLRGRVRGTAVDARRAVEADGNFALAPVPSRVEGLGSRGL
ncbi:hypothetical protein B0T26DRAFT_718294 [Lasiosphaeria miniovina]|uniref:Uncharacterized protein n=1 Tax=Lasiosphaeria miniovina TaxID=1954250 RepID=A0AA40DRR7_9PEZI|nr:uncharacterized protein B0T26DRAFT_718294 [Lasiosphaeria miniovina]KAK0713764.1 hypothetical protein B0T26DRAFT_718294 [Lasiosphaeria miniovina]